MMKNNIKLFAFILLFHLFVLNQTENPLLNIEFLMQGVILDPFDETINFSLYNYVLNLGLMILFISTVFQPISQKFEMRSYIITRCGSSKFKSVLISVALKMIFKILVMKQIIYLLFFIYTRSFTMFYFYDMGSTFLTLLMFALFFIWFKLYGIKDKVPLFVIMGINMISQMLSNDYRIFSMIVVASPDWQYLYLSNIIGKMVLILVLGSMICLQKNLDKMLGVKE